MSHPSVEMPPWAVAAIIIIFPLWWLFVVFMLERMSPLWAIRKRFPRIPLEVPVMRLGSARMGMMNYGNCIRLGLSREGLFLKVIFPFSVRPKLTFIPLAELRDLVAKRFLFWRWIELSVGSPALTTLRLPAWLFEGSEIGQELRSRSQRSSDT